MAGSTQPLRVTETVMVAATSASHAVALPGHGGSALAHNSGADIAFAEFGTSGTNTATPTNLERSQK
jgi:hypothetical protein